jgi:LysM repeat protein
MSKRYQYNQDILCSICGSKVPSGSKKCLVCGSKIQASVELPIDAKSIENKKQTPKNNQNSNTKKTLISLPIIILLIALFVSVGGGLVFVSMKAIGGIYTPTATILEEETPTPSLTPTIELPTATITPFPSPTPFSYIVKNGDLCSGISIAFNVSVNSIILENNLDQTCTIFEGAVLLIPHPTPTPIPAPTETPNPEKMTEIACDLRLYIVQSGNTLDYISAFYQVPAEAIITQNKLSSTSLFIGQNIWVPLCKRSAVGNSTVTPTVAPPYPAPKLLRPRNGEAYALDGELTINLQWSSVGELRDNEFYKVTIIDITSGSNNKIIEIVKETNFNIPITFAPSFGSTHTYQWSIIPIAQIGFSSTGENIFVDGGPSSDFGTFSWTNSNSP